MSIIIPVNEKFRIEFDGYSWAVAIRKPRKDETRKQWQQVAWHKNLIHAAESLRRWIISDSEASGIDEVIRALSTSTALIVQAIQDAALPNSWLEVKN